MTDFKRALDAVDSSLGAGTLDEDMYNEDVLNAIRHALHLVERKAFGDVIKAETVGEDASILIEAETESSLFALYCVITTSVADELKITPKELTYQAGEATSQWQLIEELEDNGLEVDVDAFLHELNGIDDE